MVLVFAGCKGESPTAPSTSTTPPTTSTGGTTPPASGASVTVTVSNANPVVDSTSVITATVTDNGAPVANGTAVEFRTTLGTFTEGNAQSVIRTTTNGAATATLTASTVGTAVVTATVGSTAKSANVTFAAKPVIPPPVDTSAKITGITPALGRPQGGEVLTINGVNFVAPVRVLFDFGVAGTKEATIISVTPTQIQVLTPGVDLGAGQQLQATIVLINAAGSTSEQRITSAANAFTFQSTVLTPKITTLSPSSGPIDGGTRVTIFGSGFQSPLKVQMGSITGNTWQDSQVINVTFDQVTFVTPRASDTASTGSGIVAGPVDVKIINIASATEATAANAFRFTPKMQITSISPLFGASTGGTDVRINGIGFNDPVNAYIVFGAPPVQIPMQVIRVSGTEILARTTPFFSPCASGGGVINVVNVDNGDTATAAPILFQYVAVNPIVASVTASGSPVPGSPAVVTVTNPGIGLLGTANVSGTFSDKPVALSPSLISNGSGTQTFSFAIPTNLTGFTTQQCTVSGVPGVQQIATAFPFTFTNTTTNCTATLSQALFVTPANSACVTVPVVTVSPTSVPCASGPSVTVGSSAAPFQITVSNTTSAGGQNLNVTAVTSSSPEFVVNPVTYSGIPPGSSQQFNVTFTPLATGNRPATITFSTNDPSRPTVTVPVCGAGL